LDRRTGDRLTAGSTGDALEALGCFGGVERAGLPTSIGVAARVEGPGEGPGEETFETGFEVLGEMVNGARVAFFGVIVRKILRLE